MNRDIKGLLVVVLASALACTVGKDGKQGDPGVPCSGCVNSASLASGAVTSTALAPGAVSSAALGDGVVKTANIGAQAVTGAQIADGAVATNHFAAGAVDTNAVADNSITASKLAASAVSGASIAPGSVATIQIADSSVTSAKLALGGTLASGSTLRGLWVIEYTAAAAGEAFGTFVPFGFTLGADPVSHFIASGGTPPAGCPGTVTDPQADPGHLCVYEWFNNNTNPKSLCSLGSCGISPGAATKWGVWMRTTAIGAGFAHSRGTWAVTAP